MKPCTLQKNKKINQWDRREFPLSPVVKNLPSNAEGVGLIPGWGVRSHMPCDQKTKT